MEGLVRLGFDGGRGDDTECIGAFYQEAAAAFNIRGSSSKKGVRIWAEAGWQQARHAPIRGEVRRLRWDGQGWCVASAGRRQPRADRVDNGLRWLRRRVQCSAAGLVPAEKGRRGKTNAILGPGTYSIETPGGAQKSGPGVLEASLRWEHTPYRQAAACEAGRTRQGTVAPGGLTSLERSRRRCSMSEIGTSQRWVREQRPQQGRVCGQSATLWGSDL